MADRTYTLNGGGLQPARSAGGGIRGGTLTAHDAHNFELSVQKFVETMGLNFRSVIRDVAIELRDRVMRGNPVDTGRSRDSWQLTVGSPSTWAPALPWHSDDRRGKNWPPPPPDAALAQFIDGTKPIFLVSNVFYVEYLEQGSSRQAPFGFVRLAAQAVAGELDDIVRRSLAGETFRVSMSAGTHTPASPAAYPRKHVYN